MWGSETARPVAQGSGLSGLGVGWGTDRALGDLPVATLHGVYDRRRRRADTTYLSKFLFRVRKLPRPRGQFLARSRKRDAHQ